MSATLTIRNVPDHLDRQLKARARKNHRSLQGELLAIIEHAVGETRTRPMTIGELSAYVQSLGLKTEDEATRWIREDRDNR